MTSSGGIQPYSHNLSPLDRLEEHSRKLAHNLDTSASSVAATRDLRNSRTNGHSNPTNHNKEHVSYISSNSDPRSYSHSSSHLRSSQTEANTENQPPYGSSSSTTSDDNCMLASPVQIAKLSIQDDEDDKEANSDEDDMFRSSRASIASFATTGGGILDSFRLSSLPKEIYANGSIDSDVSSSYRLSLAPSIKHASPEANSARTVAPPAITSQFQSLRTSAYNKNATPNNRHSSAHVPAPGPSLASPRDAHYRPSSSVYPIDDSASMYSRKSHSELLPPKSPLTPHSPLSPKDPSRKKSPYFFPDPVDVRSRYQVQNQSHHRPFSSHSDIRTNSSPNLHGLSSPFLQSPHSHNHMQLLIPPPLRRNAASSDTFASASSTGSSATEIALDKRFNQMTNEEHTTIGIELHEKGQLREASYHWQTAAQQGDLTGMLLYGLALRHGWGMRQNPTEAIKWLQTAMEASLKAFDLEGSASSDTVDKRATTLNLGKDENISKSKRSQIALALYELGMSYLHSWGTEKNEPMALRSFEMAGNLGDADALCEAAAMYMHSGPGRKKDMHTAARLYRKAGELGASMVGNSWIYKSKYTEDKSKKKKK